MSFRSLWIGAFTAAAVFGAATTANSATISIAPGDVVNVIESDEYNKDTGFQLAGNFSDVFTFNNLTGNDTFLRFRIQTTFDNGSPPVIGNLTFVFDNNGTIQTFADLTDTGGTLNPNPSTIFAEFLSAGPTVLTVTGFAIASPTGSKGGSYDFTANVVPLPPALLLFGTALGGMGWLSRRRKESATA